MLSIITIFPFLIHNKNEHFSGNSMSLNYVKWIQWLGNFHPVIIHFPIALIIMTAIAELIGVKSHLPIFKQAARFMIISAAVTAVPAALLGLAYGYDVNYDGVQVQLFWWHRFCGLSTAALAIITVIFKELHITKKIGVSLYVISLSLLVVFVTVGSYLGGEMTFGLFHLYSGFNHHT